jgi:hypothetical protein
MANQRNLITEEFERITGEGPKRSAYYYTAEIVAGGVKIAPFRITILDVVRDYNGNYADDIRLEFFIGTGTLYGTIIPNKDQLVVYLRRQPVIGVSGEKNKNAVTEAQAYRGALLEGPSANINSATPDNLTKSGADLASPVVVIMQLTELVVEQIRMQTTGGIYYDEVPADVLRAMLGNDSYIPTGDHTQRVRGVDLVPPSNTTVRRNIIIEQGTPLIELPNYFQYKLGGIYSTGMGYYLQKGLWYLYPAADCTRWNKPHKSLTVINVPETMAPGLDRTYRKTSNQVIILCTGKLRHFDNTEEVQLNRGNGARFTKAENIPANFGEYTKDNRYLVSRKKNNTEFYSMQRRTGLQKSMTSKQKIVSNAFVEYSDIAFGECTYVMIEWQNSNESLIYPGMPTKIVYEDNNEVKSLLGVVHKAHHVITGDSNSMVDTKHKTTSVITVLIAKQ